MAGKRRSSFSSEGLFSIHEALLTRGREDGRGRQTLGLEFHRPTPVGECLVPRHIVVFAFVAIDHFSCRTRSFSEPLQANLRPPLVHSPSPEYPPSLLRGASFAGAPSKDLRTVFTRRPSAGRQLQPICQADVHLDTASSAARVRVFDHLFCGRDLASDRTKRRWTSRGQTVRKYAPAFAAIGPFSKLR